MRSARRSAAGRGSMLALALSFVASIGPALAGQATPSRMLHQGAILVQAVDTSINPLAAEIVLPAFGLGVLLSDEGVVLLMNIPDGTYLVQARHLGHRPEWRVVRIAGDTAKLDFILAPADLASRGGHALAESRLREFLRRTTQIEQGSFITRAEIERRRPRNLAALLSRMPEITVERGGVGPTVVRSKRTGVAGCSSGMLLFVDGMVSNPAPILERPPGQTAERGSMRGAPADRASFASMIGRTDPSRWPRASARDIAAAESNVSSGPTNARNRSSPLDWVPIGLVSGIEIYPTMADVPVEFRIAGSECGAVLVWTLRR